MVQNNKSVPKFRQEREPKRLLDINIVIVFFAVSAIILGICMISSSVYANTKINETVKANTKPVVETIRNDDNNTVEIHVTHIRPIKSIVYRWNSGEETILSGENKTDVTKTIDLIGGTNNLVVKVTEENGQTVIYQKEYSVNNVPIIELEAVSDGVKLKVTSSEEIDYISYNIDNESNQTIDVGSDEYEGIIAIQNGKHTLNIDVVGESGLKTSKSQLVVGDIAPTVKLSADIVDGKLSFIVDAEDDEQISEVEVVLNNGVKQTITVNDKKYHGEFAMTEGENFIKVTVYNLNGLTGTQGAKFTN